jgi:hypothetical protein
MQRFPKQILININQDYKVVINIHMVIIQHNMKLNSTFGFGIQVIGVVEIRINSQPYKGINLTMLHMRAMKVPRVDIVHDAIKESGRVLPHPSVVFNVNASADIRG